MTKTSKDNNSINIEDNPTQHFISQPSWNYEDECDNDNDHVIVVAYSSTREEFEEY